jgi:hypothetical protein
MHDLNHPKVTPFTRDVGSRLHLDPTFVDFVLSKHRPECFEYWCADSDRGWTCFIPEKIEVAYPLWCTNADQTLLLTAGGEISYAKGWHDNPDIEMIARTSQGLLAHLMNEIWESESTEAEMWEAAEACGFRYLREYFEFANEPEPPGSDWEAIWNQFVSKIDAKALHG